MKKNIFTVLLIASSILSQGQEYTKVKEAKNVENLLMLNSNKTHSIISDFTQEKHLDYLDVVLESSGKFWFKKDNYLRWEYTKPIEYSIFINNGVFTIKDEEKINTYDVESNKIFAKINDLIISSVRGNLLEKDEFEIQILENRKFYLVKLNPKEINMKKVLSQIELYFNRTDLGIARVTMIENERDYTVINFTNKKINEDIPSDIFIAQ